MYTKHYNEYVRIHEWEGPSAGAVLSTEHTVYCITLCSLAFGYLTVAGELVKVAPGETRSLSSQETL